MNLQRTPTMKLRSRDIPEDETRGEPSNVAGEKTSFQNEKNTEISSMNIATTNVVYTSRTPRMTAEVTSTMANLVLPGSPRHCQVSNIPYEATCVNDRATTNQFNLVPHSDRRDNGHEVDQASMITGTTFFPISEHLSAAQNLRHRTTYNFTPPNSELHQNQSPLTTRANNQQGSYDTRQTTQEPEMWERENNAPPFPSWNDFLQNISAPPTTNA